MIDKISNKKSTTPTLLCEKEVAKLLGLSIKTLQKWRIQGEGPPFIRLSPKAIRYQLDDVLAWLQANRRTSTSEEA